MKEYGIHQIRNIGLLSDGGAGKTTLAEAILFNAGVTNRLGKVTDGNTVMDYDPDEHRRGCSINAAVASFFYKNKKVNLIDTPGYANFISDTIGCLRVIDGAIFLVSAVDGLKVQTEKLWNSAKELGIPRILFVNEMDRSQAELEKVLEEIKDELGAKPILLTYPIGKGDNFTGVVELLTKKTLVYEGEEGKFTEVEVPDDVKDAVEEAHNTLIEDIAETNDDLMEKYLEGEELSQKELLEALAQGVKEEKVFPVLVGSALLNKGVHSLMETMVEILPSPQEKPPVKGVNPGTGEEEERKCSIDDPLAALVFKTISDPYAGKITLFKVFSGVLEGDSTVYNSSKETKERVGKPFFMVGKEQKPTDKVIAGDIGAVAKLKETGTGDTLCAPDAPFLFPPIPFPEPILSFAIQAKSRSDEEKISAALQRLMEEDPGLRVKRDEQTKELIISGLGQLHLETIVERLKRKYGVEVELQTPKVPYKETVKKKVKMQGRYKKQTGGRGQYGDVWIEIEPLPRGSGFEFEDRIVGGAIPRQYIPSVEKGVRGAMQEGVLAGYPVVDVKVVLYDGSFHPVDSSDLAFQIAGSLAFKKAVAQANPILLEPIMTLEVISPDDCVGDVIGDLNAKRGKILGVEAKGKNQIIRAQVPLAEILRYAPELRSITGGRGTYSMEFSHYEEVPSHLAQKIIEKSKGEEGEG